MEPISQTIGTSFVIGIVMGIIYNLSKKLMAIIWCLAVILCVISVFFYDGASVQAEVWGVWNWIAMLITVNLSFILGYEGMKMVKESFRK